MKTIRRNFASQRVGSIFVPLVACLAIQVSPGGSRAAEPPRLTSVALSDGKLDFSWDGPGTAYQIQTASDLAQPVWRNVLSTVRTNASIPVLSGSSFFRIVDPDPNLLTLNLTMTNVVSKEGVSLTLGAPPRMDLIFKVDGESTDSQEFQVVFPSDGLKLYDIAFDGKGGFAIVTNGVPTVYGGTWKTEPGPGPHDVTHSGIFTNAIDVFEFKAVTDPAPDNDVGAGLLGGMTWIYCLPGFALKNLQCQAAASALLFQCAFQFPPKVPYGILTTHIDASGILTNHIDCITECKTGCK